MSDTTKPSVSCKFCGVREDTVLEFCGNRENKEQHRFEPIPTVDPKGNVFINATTGAPIQPFVEIPVTIADYPPIHPSKIRRSIGLVTPVVYEFTIPPSHPPSDVYNLLQDSLNHECETFALLELAEKQLQDIRKELQKNSERVEALLLTCAVQGQKLTEIANAIQESSGHPLSIPNLTWDNPRQALFEIRRILLEKPSSD